jgi:hypothetical protein
VNFRELRLGEIHADDAKVCIAPPRLARAPARDGHIFGHYARCSRRKISDRKLGVSSEARGEHGYT